MKIDDLAPAPGAHRDRRRVARGIGGKGGKTAGRGTKGQNARTSVKPGFEGGQLPLTQRIPKLRGFKNPFRIEYNVVNLDDLAALEGDEFTLESLHASGLVHAKGLVKVLGRGGIDRAIRVEAHAFSASAAEAIRSAGGSVTIVPRPFGDRRPPVKGNA
ncbi:MAG TPA: 50S ribosomal protein L15, partial [Acidimicrobiales bacterium]|nr:50S ribosomal protein L15 [Acidimicrobiales bacterium]